jgi:hypothetical protein
MWHAAMTVMGLDSTFWLALGRSVFVGFIVGGVSLAIRLATRGTDRFDNVSTSPSFAGAACTATAAALVPCRHRSLHALARTRSSARRCVGVHVPWRSVGQLRRARRHSHCHAQPGGHGAVIGPANPICFDSRRGRHFRWLASPRHSRVSSHLPIPGRVRSLAGRAQPAKSLPALPRATIAHWQPIKPSRSQRLPCCWPGRWRGNSRLKWRPDYSRAT